MLGVVAAHANDLGRRAGRQQARSARDFRTVVNEQVCVGDRRLDVRIQAVAVGFQRRSVFLWPLPPASRPRERIRSLSIRSVSNCDVFSSLSEAFKTLTVRFVSSCAASRRTSILMPVITSLRMAAISRSCLSTRASSFVGILANYLPAPRWVSRRDLHRGTLLALVARLVDSRNGVAVALAGLDRLVAETRRLDHVGDALERAAVDGAVNPVAPKIGLGIAFPGELDSVDSRRCGQTAWNCRREDVLCENGGGW